MVKGNMKYLGRYILLVMRLIILSISTKKYNKEISFIAGNLIKNRNRIAPYCMFPYANLRNAGVIKTYWDDVINLPYVNHKNKRLYFPQSYTLKKVEDVYRNFIENECILGGDYKVKQPHQYQSSSFMINDGDVLVDVGCAEALLTLDNIEKVEKAYLFEGDPKWFPALKATFMNYKEKVVIIEKYVSGKDTEQTISLSSALKCEEGKSLFVKMDIEGAEVEVLKGSKDFLTSNKNIKLACCTYHKHYDEKEVTKLVTDMGFHYELTDGYMYNIWDEKDMHYPYFRHVLLRGWK